MKINHVHAVYFSPTGNAKKVVTTLAQAIADTLGVPMDSYDFTLPESREKFIHMGRRSARHRHPGLRGTHPEQDAPICTDPF